jgi:flagellar motor switch protein FliM
MSNAILSNDEVDALLSAIESGQVLIGQNVEPKKEKKIQHYDFRRPDRFPREQKRRLQKISEDMAKAIGNSFSRMLRTNVNVELIAIEEFSYEVFVNSFTDITCANVLNLKPLHGLGLLTIDVGLCLSVLDRGLGGPGKIPQKIRALTQIEEGVVGVVLEQMLADISLCWAQLVRIEWKIETMDMDIKAVQVVHSTDVVISINFAASGDLGNGTIILCMPVSSLEMVMIKSKLDRIDRNLELDYIKEVVNEVDMGAKVLLGKTHLTLNEIINLKRGDVVRLDNKITEDMPLEIEEKTKCYGKPGVVGKKLALQVTSVKK